MSDEGHDPALHDRRAGRMNELALSGRCCTQIMVQMALDEAGAENPQMVDAVGALCLGMFAGHTCGALSGAALAMALRSSGPLDGALVKELVEWFADEFGSLDCDDILGGDPMRRFVTCPPLVSRTYEEAMDLLAAHGRLAPRRVG